MNKKPLVVAFILSIVVATVIYKNLPQNNPNNQIVLPPPPKIETKPVIVAKKRIPLKTRLEPQLLNEYFEIKQITASDAERYPDAIKDLASLTNRYTSVPILPGDIMTQQRLLNEDVIPSLAYAIPPGKRAISIAVSKVSGVGGFIQQGDYVDVIATFKPKRGDAISKIVLQDILVLAVGNMYQFDGSLATTPPAISANKVDLVTLAVTPEEAEQLMLLESSVSFRLVLKNPKDKDAKIITYGTTEKEIIKKIEAQKTEQMAQTDSISKDITSQNLIAQTQPLLSINQLQNVANVKKELHQAEVEKIEDKKVEIWYGSAENKKEYIREGGVMKPMKSNAIRQRRVGTTGIPTPMEFSQENNQFMNQQHFTE